MIMLCLILTGLPLLQSFRDIKALKAVASRNMCGTVRGTGSKKQPPTVSAQFQVVDIFARLVLSLELSDFLKTSNI